MYTSRFARRLTFAVLLMTAAATPHVDGGYAPAGEIVTRWVDRALQAVRSGNVGTPAAGRLYAMATAAMFDAVNGIDAARHRGREHAIVPATGAPALADPRAAAAAAAAEVLRSLVPSQDATLRDALEADLAALDAQRWRVQAGREWGEHVGREVLAARLTDGTEAAVLMPAGTGIGVHRAAFDARFANMNPFGVATIARYALGPPPDIRSEAYARAFNDVKTFGQSDDDDRRNEIALFWLAEGGTPRETGIWLQAVNAIVQQRGTVGDLSATARLFALVGMSIGDAVAVSWQAKATYFSWRPAIAIHEAALDENPATEPDTGWTPRNISIGASPEYMSGTSTFSGAASAAIELFYGKSQLAFCFETDSASNGPRCYRSPLEGAREAGRSRIYQGIHFQFSNEAGLEVGRRIGREIATTRLEKVRH